ncbi:MAG: hypothetical protein MZU84_03495 [Sphingobacterium sp.]|nr:hypothetical protein [Sphingobacterium sp.]
MLEIRVEGLERLRRQFAQVPERLNRAAAAGINRTARAIEQHELNAMETSIDRPTPFSLNSIQIYEAKPNSRKAPAALLKIRPIQARYLVHTIKGARLPKILEPINIRLNQYGNILGKAKGLKGIAAKGKTRFVATINGQTGVWERRRDNLRLLVRVARNVERKPRWDFYGVAERVARDRLTRDISAAITAELRAR